MTQNKKKTIGPAASSKDREKKVEEHRLNHPCPKCGFFRNTVQATLYHSAAQCEERQRRKAKEDAKKGKKLAK